MFFFCSDELDKTTSLTIVNDSEKNGVFDDRVYTNRLDLKTTKAGVYLLYNNENLVYVGQSVRIAERVIQHIRDPKKEFNQCQFFNVDKISERISMEERLIKLFRPKYNKRLPKS